MPGFDEEKWEGAIRAMYARGELTASMLSNPRINNLVQEYRRVFDDALSSHIKDNEIPETMAKHLKDDVFVFSGFKTYQGLKEASMLLHNNDGTIKPFSKFKNDIEAIKQNYNSNYLKAEYVFATQSTMMAAKWKEYETDGDDYNLQYRTANDGRVRPAHQALHNITLPPSDPFWKEYFPPNGWRCRCNVVQVRKSKYPVSDSNTAISLGKEATFEPNKSRQNKAEMFRFNPGVQEVIFPKHHPYYNVSPKTGNEIMKVLNIKKEDFTNIPTENGSVRISSKVGKTEKENNKMVASYFANKYGYDIDLLGTEDTTMPDSFNKSLNRFEEYKVNHTGTKNSVDMSLKKANKQASNIVLWFNITMPFDKMANAIADRVQRSNKIQNVTIVIDGKDHTYSRADILSDGFKIQQADLN